MPSNIESRPLKIEKMKRRHNKSLQLSTQGQSVGANVVRRTSAYQLIRGGLALCYDDAAIERQRPRGTAAGNGTSLADELAHVPQGRRHLRESELEAGMSTEIKSANLHHGLPPAVA